MSPEEPAGGSDLRRPSVPLSRLSPVYMLISAGQQLRSLGPVVLAVGIWQRTVWTYALGGLLLAVLAGIRWWNKRYSVVGGQFQVRSGLFRRSVDTIPVRRITATDAHRGFIQRAFGVWGLRVHSPGGRDPIHLACLSTSALERLRNALNPSGRESTVEVAPASRPAVVLKVLDFRTLLIAAITGTSIPLIFTGGAVAWSRVRDLVPHADVAWARREVLGHGRYTVELLVLFVVIAAITAVGLTSLRLANFTLVREGDRLRVSRGLIAQRTQTVPVDRVQAVRIVEGLLRRRLGYCQLEIEVAGLGRGNTGDRMLFPLLRTDRVPDLIARAIPELGWAGRPPEGLPRSVRRRYLTVPLLVAVPIAVGAAFLPGWGAWFAVPPVPLGLLVGVGQGQSAAWLLDEQTLTLRWRRILARHTMVARVTRMQLTCVTTTPFQRRAGLAGFTVELSSRRKGRLRHLPAADAGHLAHVVARRGVVFSGR